jgi:hypothetical protein
MLRVEEADQSEDKRSADAQSASAPRHRLAHRNKILIAALVVAAVAAGVGVLLFRNSGEDLNAVRPKSDVDIARWKTEVAAMSGASANPDMDTLYDVTVKDCNDTQDQMTLGLTLAGVNPNLIRTDMNYVCPGRAHMVDDGLLKIQQNDSELSQICRTPPSMRTEQQAELIGAIGPGACQGQ